MGGCGLEPVQSFKVCTAVGCDNGVHFTLAADLVAVTEYTIAVCIDEGAPAEEMLHFTEDELRSVGH